METMVHNHTHAPDTRRGWRVGSRLRYMFACTLVGGMLASSSLVSPAWAAEGITPQNAQAHWSFESQADNAYVNDGTNHNLRINVSGAGVQAQASDLDGLGTSLYMSDKNTDYTVSVANPVNSQGTYTISMWMKSTDSSPDPRTILLQFSNQGRTLLYNTNENNFGSYLAGSDLALGADPNRGNWEFITLTKSGEPRALSLYVNGKKLQTATWDSNLPANPMDLIFGKHKNANPDPTIGRFQGYLDEISIFDRALSDQQVKELYSSYGDIVLPDELTQLIAQANTLYNGTSELQDTPEFVALKAAIDKAQTARDGDDLEQMKAAKAELDSAYQSAKQVGPVVRVNPSEVTRTLSDSLFGINHRYSNYGYGTVDPETGEVRPAFASLYKKAGFGSMRYPGGTISNNYVWTESIGPIAERTPQIHGYYNNRGQTGFAPAFGIFEVAKFAEDMNSEVIWVYGFGRGDADDAADLVEFLNAPAGTNPNGGVAWADKRAELGHAKPFNIRYFEIGNEMNLGGTDGNSSQRYWLGYVDGGPLNAYVNGGTARFNKQYAIVRGDWNVVKSYSTGEPNQEFGMRYALIPRQEANGSMRDAVDVNSVRVYVGDELWQPVDDLSTAQASDKVYKLDRTTGYFTFGDGTHGAIPAQGQQIKVDYTVTRGGFVQLSKAMHNTMAQIDPDYKSKGSFNIYSSWENRDFINKMHEVGADQWYDGIAVHPYSGTPTGNANTPTETDKKAWYLNAMQRGNGSVNRVRHVLDPMRATTGDESKVPVISEFGIYNSTNPMVRSQAHALYIARAIMDYVDLDSPYIQKHCLVDYYSSGGDSLGPTQQGVIQAVALDNLQNQKDGSGPFAYFSTPSASIFEMLSSSFGNQKLATSLINEGTMSNGVAQHKIMASKDSDGRIYIAIVNLGLNDMEQAGADGAVPTKVTLDIDGVDLTDRDLTIKTLSGTTFYAENSLEQPNNVTIQTTTARARTRRHTLDLAPHSFTIVTVEPETPKHTVTFNAEGKTFASAEVAEGSIATEPNPAPAREGYSFAGWYDAEGNAYDFSTPVSDDLTLVAKWSTPLTKLERSTPIAQPSDPGTPGDKPEPVQPEPGEPNQPGDKPSDPGTPGDKPEPVQPSEPQPGTPGDKPEPVQPGTPATPNPGQPSNPNPGTPDEPGQPSNPATPDEPSYEWQVLPHNLMSQEVRFVSDEGMVVSVVVERGSVVDRPQDPVREGYSFLGWFDAQGAAYDFSLPVEEDLTLTAHWEPTNKASESTPTTQTPAPQHKESSQGSSLPHTGDISPVVGGISATLAVLSVSGSLLIRRRKRS